jgi:osmotically inducible protein OsmC
MVHLGEALVGWDLASSAGAIAQRRRLPNGRRASRVPPQSQQEKTMIRKAKAVWRGTGKDGTGKLTSDSGVLSNTPYSAKMRFDSEPGTNPEELIAAAHSGCFAMALAFQLSNAGFEPTELEVEAAVSLTPQNPGFKIDRSALTLRAVVPGIDRAKFDELAANAKAGCPVSKVLNAEITLDATLA